MNERVSSFAIVLATCRSASREASREPFGFALFIQVLTLNVPWKIAQWMVPSFHDYKPGSGKLVCHGQASTVIYVTLSRETIPRPELQQASSDKASAPTMADHALGHNRKLI